MNLDEVKSKLELPTEIILILVILFLQFFIPSAISDFLGTIVIAAVSFYAGRKLGKKN